MDHSHPRVSIGLPVYNGERFVSDAIDSLLAQTFRDFEIIICDNASTDGTEAICRRYAKRDKRIRYYRNSGNLGAAANFNRTFELASGEYFKWAAHDDICAPDFLFKCVEVLDKNSSIVLCHSEVQWIDEFGEPIANRGAMLNETESPEAHVRFKVLSIRDHWAFDIFSLIRAGALSKTPLIEGYVGSDKNTLVSLALQGKFYHIPECLFFTRDHSERSMKKTKLAFRVGWFDPKKKGRISYYYWRIFFEYAKSVSKAELCLRDRTYCYIHLLKYLRKNYRRLKLDLKVGLEYHLWRIQRLTRKGRKLLTLEYLNSTGLMEKIKIHKRHRVNNKN